VGLIWAASFDFAKTPFGRYIHSDKEGAFIEFCFLGQAFELQYVKGPDHGIFKIEVDGTALELMPGTIVGDYTGNQVDAYSAAYGRENIGIRNTTWGYHRVTAQMGFPRTKNGISSGYEMAFTGFLACNDSGYECIGISRENVYTSVSDSRDFIPLEDRLDDSAAVSAEGLERAAKVALVSGTTSASVTLAAPMPDLNYVITANMMNTTDASPSFQPLVITAQSLTGFTISWNTPLASANYELAYYVRSI
jgi:hypothetical protein